MNTQRSKLEQHIESLISLSERAYLWQRQRGDAGKSVFKGLRKVTAEAGQVALRSSDEIASSSAKMLGAGRETSMICAISYSKIFYCGVPTRCKSRNI